MNNLRDQASQVLGFRLPEDSSQWVDAIRSHTQGDIDANKKWNMTLLLLIRLNELENK
jgi:hypothetical protein